MSSLNQYRGRAGGWRTAGAHRRRSARRRPRPGQRTSICGLPGDGSRRVPAPVVIQWRHALPFQRLNSIVKGRRAISADTALLLHALTGWDAQLWLAFQAKWDLWHALRARGARPKVKPLRTIPARRTS